MAIITKIIAIEFMSVVMVVELSDRLGILWMALLVIMNNNLDPNAKVAPKINRQSRIIFIILDMSMCPDIRSRLPKKVMEAAVMTENSIAQKNTINISDEVYYYLMIDNQEHISNFQR